MASHGIPQRERFFVCAEGESERSLAKWLQLLCNEQKLHVHLDICVAQGGDSLAVVEFANFQYQKRRNRFGEYVAGFVLLDNDRLDRDRQSGRDPEPALAPGLQIVFLKPNLEGVLLRLHSGRETLRPTARSAPRALKKDWPEYRKPAAADDLNKRFKSEDLRRAAMFDAQLKWVMETLGLGDDIWQNKPNIPGPRSPHTQDGSFTPLPLPSRSLPRVRCRPNPSRRTHRPARQGERSGFASPFSANGKTIKTPLSGNRTARSCRGFADIIVFMTGSSKKTASRSRITLPGPNENRAYPGFNP